LKKKSLSKRVSKRAREREREEKETIFQWRNKKAN